MDLDMHSGSTRITTTFIRAHNIKISSQPIHLSKPGLFREVVWQNNAIQNFPLGLLCMYCLPLPAAGRAVPASLGQLQERWLKAVQVVLVVAAVTQQQPAAVLVAPTGPEERPTGGGVRKQNESTTYPGLD